MNKERHINKFSEFLDESPLNSWQISSFQCENAFKKSERALRTVHPQSMSNINAGYEVLFFFLCKKSVYLKYICWKFARYSVHVLLREFR